MWLRSTSFCFSSNSSGSKRHFRTLSANAKLGNTQKVARYRDAACILEQRKENAPVTWPAESLLQIWLAALKREESLFSLPSLFLLLISSFHPVVSLLFLKREESKQGDQEAGFLMNEKGDMMKMSPLCRPCRQRQPAQCGDAHQGRMSPIHTLHTEAARP
jgi:hypothetical protein